MSKKKRITLALMAVIVLGGIAWLALPTGESEPVCDGKPLDVWLLGYRSPDPDYSKKAVAITHELGTNAMPTLLRMLHAHDPLINRHVMEFARRQSSYRVHYISSGIRNAAAANACEELGDMAKTAVPALVALLSSPDTYVRSAASNALRRIDPEAAMR